MSHSSGRMLRAGGFVATTVGLAVMLGLMGCTGIAKVDRAQIQAQAKPKDSVPLRLCIYKDRSVSMAQADRIVSALKKEFAPYGLDIQVTGVLDWKREDFSHTGILNDIARRPLKAPADRYLALVGREVRDFLWGALLPEVLGEVEILTHTKGFVVAQWGSFNQLLTFHSPADVAVHEFYHMLGCTHEDDGRTIAAKIGRLKRIAERNRAMGRDFFPGIDNEGHIYLTRREVDARLGLAYAGPSAPALSASLTKLNGGHGERRIKRLQGPGSV